MKDSAQKMSTTALGRAVRRVGLGLLAVLFSAGATFAQINAYVASTGNTSVLTIDTATNTVTASVSGAGNRVVTLSPDGKFIYATQFNGIAKIDTATNSIVASVATGLIPIGIAVTHDGATAYVANNNSLTNSVIDTATMTVTSTIPSLGPSAMTMTPDGTSVWLSDAFGVVSVIDTATSTVSTTFPLGTAPASIAFSPDGAFAYLANFGANSFTVLDTTTHTVVATVPVGNRPFYVALTPDGAFAYVANLLSNTVSIIDTATNTVAATVPVGGFPRAIAFTPDGASAYVTNFNDNTISVIDTVTQAVVSTFPAGSRPWGIAIMQDSDHDGVPNNHDNCPGTTSGDTVDSAGCSIAQLCPCAGPWKNHGKYVSCVAHASESFVDAGLITEAQKGAIVSAAGQSSCGK